MDENHIAKEVIGAAIEVHRNIGPGMLELTYQQCLSHELQLRQLSFQTEVFISLGYKGLEIKNAYKADFIVAEKLIVELKSVERIEQVHISQLLTYLRWADCRLVLLINFNVPLLKSGIRRIANNLN